MKAQALPVDRYFPSPLDLRTRTDARADFEEATVAEMKRCPIYSGRFRCLFRRDHRTPHVFDVGPSRTFKVLRSTPAESSGGAVAGADSPRRRPGAGESEAPAPSSSIEREIPGARIPRALGTAE